MAEPVVTHSLTTAETVSFLLSLPLFRGYERDDCDVLARNATIYSWPKHATIYSQGDAANHICIVLRGKVTLARDGWQEKQHHGTSRQCRKMHRLVNPGDYFGEAELMAEGVARQCTAKASGVSGATTVISFSREVCASFFLRSSIEILKAVTGAVDATASGVQQRLLDQQMPIDASPRRQPHRPQPYSSRPRPSTAGPRCRPAVHQKAGSPRGDRSEVYTCVDLLEVDLHSALHTAQSNLAILAGMKEKAVHASAFQSKHRQVDHCKLDQSLASCNNHIGGLLADIHARPQTAGGVRPTSSAHATSDARGNAIIRHAFGQQKFGAFGGRVMSHLAAVGKEDNKHGMFKRSVNAVHKNKRSVNAIHPNRRLMMLSFKGLDEAGRLKAVLQSFSPERVNDWMTSKQALFTGLSHLHDAVSPRSPAPVIPEKKSTATKQMCQQFILDGKCHWGSNCLFMHPKPPQKVVPLKRILNTKSWGAQENEAEEKLPLEHVFKDIAGVVWEHEYVKAESEFIGAMDSKKVRDTGNPWGLTTDQVFAFIAKDNAQGLLNRLGLGGHISSGIDVLHNPDVVNLDDLYGQLHSTELYSKVVALSLFFKIVMTLDSSHSHGLRECLRTMMREYRGGSVLLSRMWDVPTVWWDLKNTGKQIVTALGDKMRKFFRRMEEDMSTTPKLEMSQIGMLRSVENRAPEKKPLRCDPELIFPSREGFAHTFSQHNHVDMQKATLFYHDATAMLIVAAANLCNREFQSAVEEIVIRCNTNHLAAGFKVSVPIGHHEAVPKTYGRCMLKYKLEHMHEREPKVACNVDCVRCALMCPPESTPDLHAALCGLGRVVRVKNAFHEKTVNDPFGFRAIVTNHSVEFNSVTLGDVAAEMRRLVPFVFTKTTISCEHETLLTHGAPDATLQMANWLEANQKDEPVSLICETQIILPKYVEARQSSHFPAKVERAATANDLAKDLKAYYRTLR